MISAETRLHATPIWSMIDFLLNGVLFLLLGLQMKRVVTSVPHDGLMNAIAVSAAIAVAIVLLRLFWVYVTIYSRWLWKKRGEPDADPPRRGHVFLVAWTGMRGAISLAAAFAIPLTLPGGAAFPQRDLIIFGTFAVIIVTLVVQGGTLPWVIRVLGIEREGETERDERVVRELEVRIEVVDAGIARLKELTTAGEIPEEVSVRHRAQLDQAKRTLRRQLAGQEDEKSEAIAEREIFANLQVIEAQRAKLLELRAAERIDDEAVQRIQRDLDEQELRLQELEETLT
jgi:CPA1 family monovalent cation:H+ antiporter